MTHTFYLLETYVPQVFKFGYTKQDLQSRMKRYTGVSKPKQIIYSFKTRDGVLMEDFFKCFLKSKNIKPDKRFGREYFVFDNKRISVMNEFKNMFADNTTKKNNTLLNNNTLAISPKHKQNPFQIKHSQTKRNSPKQLYMFSSSVAPQRSPTVTPKTIEDIIQEITNKSRYSTTAASKTKLKIIPNHDATKNPLSISPNN